MIIQSLLYLLIAAVTTATAPTPSNLKIESCNFGEAYAFNYTECPIALSNDSDKPIHITESKAVSDKDTIEPRSLTIDPHARGYLHAKIFTGNSLATSGQHQFRFRADESGHEERGASAFGFVMTTLDQAKPELDFGVVELGSAPEEKTILLSSHDVAQFRIDKILETPAYIDATIDPTGLTLTAKVRANAEWGLHADFIKLAINTPRQKEAWVLVKADVHGDIVPESNPFDMSLMRFGNHNEHVIRLTSKSRKNFTLGKVTIEDVKGEATIEPCKPKMDGCQAIKFIVSDQQPSGSITGRILVDLPEFGAGMSVNVWGLIVPKELKIRTLDQNGNEKKDGDNSQAIAEKPVAQKPEIDIGKALKSVVKQANQPPPSGTGPLLKWSIGNDQPIYGYEIFRSNSDTGTFVRVNESTIRAAQDNEDSNSYQWRDNTAESGKTYWYYIGLIYNDGHKQQLSGPQKIVAH